MKNHWISFITLLALILAGCKGSPQAAVEKSPDTTLLNPQEVSTKALFTAVSENPLQLESTPESIEMPSNPPPVEKFVALSKKDLASRLQSNADKISLVKTEEIIWPDAALGCPSPGKVYAQGRVPGYRLWLEMEGKEYIYHTDLNGQVILCPEQDSRGSSNSLPSSSPTPQIGVPID